MKHTTTLLTIGTLGFLSAYSMYLGWTEIAFLSIGALVGYLGKVNGGSSGASDPGR